MQSKLTTIFLGICAVCLVFLCAAIIFTAVKYAPGLDNAMTSLEQFSAQMEEMGTAMDSMVVATDQLKKIDFESVNQLVNESRSSMAAAMTKIEEFDIKTLNEAIRNLNDTVEPLARFFNILN